MQPFTASGIICLPRKTIVIRNVAFSKRSTVSYVPDDDDIERDEIWVNQNVCHHHQHLLRSSFTYKLN